MLKGTPSGSFLVRESSSQVGQFALSVVTNRRVAKEGLEHLLIIPSFAGTGSTAPGNTRYRLGTNNHAMFNTIAKLIAYYIGHELKVDGFVAGFVCACSVFFPPQNFALERFNS